MSPYLKKVIYSILTGVMDREKLLSLLANKEEKALLNFKRENYLHEVGWVNSILADDVVDQANNPLPWVTYPFIQFIAGRLNDSLEIFEFGSGNSTFYYATRVATVDCVENDRFWYDKIKNRMPANVNLFFCELVCGGDYCKYSTAMNKRYDIIIVDGRDRVNCCINSVTALNAGGVLVLDDAEREKYNDAEAFLKEKGFRSLDFWGIAPAISYLKCTRLFYRDNNCLGI